MRDEKVFVSLSYTPRAQTLKRKFGTLPVRYMKAKISNTEEFAVIQDVIQRYRFNLLDEENDQSLSSSSSSSRRGNAIAAHTSFIPALQHPQRQRRETGKYFSPGKQLIPVQGGVEDILTSSYFDEEINRQLMQHEVPLSPSSSLVAAAAAAAPIVALTQDDIVEKSERGHSRKRQKK